MGKVQCVKFYKGLFLQAFFISHLCYSAHMEQKLEKVFIIALQNLGIADAHFTLEHPDLQHGDYTCNAAMVYAKQLGMSPVVLAEKIIQEINNQSIPEIASCTIAGPGFINIQLVPEFFLEQLATIVSNQDFGNNTTRQDQKILIEHSSPNLFKPFHIGHMMNNTIGESLVRLFRASGAQVTTLSFPSDISLGVAKAIFIILEQYGADFIPGDIAVLGDAYVAGTRRYEDDPLIQDRVKEIADNLYAGNDSPEWSVYNRCKEFNIRYFESITKKLGSQFDGYVYESQAGVVGKQIVLENTPSIFTESEGAIIYTPDLEKKPWLNISVFINSQGNPTYEAKDLGLLKIKFDTYNPDTSIFVTDKEQSPHFSNVLDAGYKINQAWADRSFHCAHGRMAFKGQKMSSRLGNTPLVSDMIELVLDEVKERSQDRSIDSATQESIAIGALKFAILKAKPGENINFDPEVNLSFEGDSGPYLQYTHARIASLLEKANIEGFVPQIVSNEPVDEIERLVYRLPQIIARATEHFSPNYVVTYLLEIARSFNSFYGSYKIIDTENKQATEHRLAIALAVKTVLKNGLYVLGINAPDKM